MRERVLFSLLLIFVLAAIVAIVFIIINLSKRKNAQMQSDILALLEDIRLRDPNNIKYEMIIRGKHEPEKPYNYKLETENFIYYIKVVPNFYNEEICINNSVKWQVKRNYKDEHIKFVPNIDLLMRLDLEPKENGKKTKKLYIIYPDAKSLLKYINECELEFVHYHTDVYGTNITTYQDLKNHINYIKL